MYSWDILILTNFSLPLGPLATRIRIILVNLLGRRLASKPLNLETLTFNYFISLQDFNIFSIIISAISLILSLYLCMSSLNIIHLIHSSGRSRQERDNNINFSLLVRKPSNYKILIFFTLHSLGVFCLGIKERLLGWDLLILNDFICKVLLCKYFYLIFYYIVF